MAEYQQNILEIDGVSMNKKKSLCSSSIPRVPSKSPYSVAEKIRMATWWFVESVFFKPSPHICNKFRCFLLRLFGAKIGANTFIHSSAKIWFPWNLSIGSNSGIGFDALIYNLDAICIGDYSTISQRCHLNTGSHDYVDIGFKLIKMPINISDGVFVGTDSYIGMGVSIGEMSVIGARSVVISSQPDYVVCVGHPCRPIKNIKTNFSKVDL